MGKMKTDIFIKTCEHDRPYHAHCMESISRYCSGFGRTIVVDGEHAQGYLHQQVVKLHADTYSSADYILVTDSDTLFTTPVTPQSFMRDGRPMWLMTPWSQEMLAHPGTSRWFHVMKAFFGVEPRYEMMRRQPFMFPRHVLERLRAYCLRKHGKTIEMYIMQSGAFSEWNILGMFCHMFHHEEFHWIDTEHELPPTLVRQFWSHDPIGKNIEEIEGILK